MTHSWGGSGAGHAGVGTSAWGGKSSPAQTHFRSVGTRAVFPHGHEALAWARAGPS